MKSIHTLLVMLGSALAAVADTPAVLDGYTLSGELPQPLAEVDKPTPGRLPIAVVTQGDRQDLIVLANNRLWYYINESQPGKIQFKAPIELTDTVGRPVRTECVFSTDANTLKIHLALDIFVEAKVVFTHAPKLDFADAPASATRPEPVYRISADFDGDGAQDIIIGGKDATTVYSAKGK